MTRKINNKNPLYLFVEGKTERGYMQDFAKQNLHIQIKIVKETSSRPKLIEEALKFSKEYKLDSWIVFDQDDKFEEAREIYNKADTFNREHRAQIHIIYSAPCFELWLLIHFQNNIPSSVKEVQRCLREHIKYNHGKNPTINIEKLKFGYENAVKIAKQLKKSLGDTPNTRRVNLQECINLLKKF